MSFLVGFRTAKGKGAVTMRPHLEITPLQRHQLGPAAEAVIGHGQKRPVAQAPGTGVGRCQHAVDQVAG